MTQSNGNNAPNLLLIMVDQMAAPALPLYGHRLVRAPHIQSLGESGVVFDNAYCNFPICAPSRFSMLSGRLPTAIDAFDNAAEFPASVPTLAHYLRALGYSTTLCGKMHFIGPDQLHGFEERLTTDVYPSNFAWTPNWLEGEHNKPSGVSMRSVVEAGRCVRSMQIDYDDEVEYFGLQKLYDLARTPQQRPFFLTISFTHPHPAFVISDEYWNRYEHDAIDLPTVSAIPTKDLDPYSRWLYYAHGGDFHTVTDAHIRNARHAYYGMISYVDDKVGRILKTLKETALDDNTIVLFLSDHGEMLGERGMWYKQTFFEWSSRVPLIVSYPGVLRPRRQAKVVSLVDLLPTILDLVTGGRAPEAAVPFDGRSMIKLLYGDDIEWPDIAISEYTAEGVRGPCRMIRRGRYKYIYTHRHPGQLYDLEQDPNELVNLFGRLETAGVENELVAQVLDGWDPDEIYQRVLASQKRRLFIHGVAKLSAASPNWAFEARSGDARRFVRDSGEVVEAKARARYPYVPPVPPDKVPDTSSTAAVGKLQGADR